MKAACVILSTIIVVALMAVCLMVKFATEISYDERRRAGFEGIVHSYSESMGVIELNENNTQIMELAEKYPSITAIFSNSSTSWSFSCFGCIILARWVITAAHCRKTGSMHRALLYYDYIRNVSKTMPIFYWKINKDFKVNGSAVKYDLAVGKLDAGLDATMKSAIFDDKEILSNSLNAVVWKTVQTMDKRTYLTNDLEVFQVTVARKSECFETFGVQLDESLICIEFSHYDDCFTHEFGPLFHGEKLVGILAMKPRDCDMKLAIFTNISFYAEWILRTTKNRGFV